jgi:2,4-dienoyl-CoA reductase-like NADH-dependent reductase (Old Yellow Enzyme family)
MTQSPLFTPIRIGKLELSGCVIKAATNEGLCNDDGSISDDMIEFHEQIAKAGTPMQVVGASYFSAQSKQARHKQNACDSDDKIPGMRLLAAAVHKHGGKIFGQPNHPGRQCVPRGAGIPYAQAPSRVLEPTLMTAPRPMTKDEIRETVKRWAEGAERYQKGDFDGVEIHASQGYLLTEFLSPHTNRRKDEYGGSFDNRMRLLLEVYHAIRERVGSDYPVIMKMNGHDELPLGGLNTAELVKVAKRMEDEGIDAIELIAGHYQSGLKGFRGNWRGFFRANATIGVGQYLRWYYRDFVRLVGPAMDWAFRNIISSYSEGFTLKYAREFKRALKIPVSSTGGFVHREAMERAIATGDCDMVSLGRALIADPYLYKHMKEGVKGPECSFCNRCLARATLFPVDCYDEKIREEKYRMLAGEAA